MSYTIKKSDGTPLADVPENEIVIDKASVALIGRGSINYGNKHSEAFVHLLENFAHTEAPAHPLTGQLWFDKSVSALKIFNDGEWVPVNASVGGATASGPIYVPIGDSGVLALLAAGKVVAAISSQNFPNGDLPETITVLQQSIPFRARFPFGIVGGFNLATDPTSYIINGHVPNADASIWAGGGNPFAATTFIDLGATSIALTISNNAVVAAYSQSATPANLLPESFSVNNITIPLRGRFGSGLRAGLTMADDMSIGIGAATISGSTNIGGSGGSVTTSIVAEMINQEAIARASAVTNLYSYANTTFATSGLVNTLTSSFLEGTGKSSISEAVQYLITSASSGTANADYAIALRNEIKNAITGSTSFSDALHIINSNVGSDHAKASDLTALSSSLTTAYGTAISNATRELVTATTLTSALSKLETDLSTTFGGGSGSIKDLKEVLVGPNGTTARAVLNLTADGKVAGITSTVTKQSSSLVFNFDSVSIINPATNAPIFKAEGGKVKMPNVEIDALAVDTVNGEHLRRAAVLKSSFVSTSAVTYCPRNVTTTVCSFTFLKEDSDSILKIMMFAQCFNGDDLQFNGDILLDGNVVQRAVVNMIFDNKNSQGQVPVTPFAFLPGIAAGEHIVSFTLFSLETEYATQVQPGATLEVTELRRGATASPSGSGGVVQDAMVGPSPTPDDGTGTSVPGTYTPGPYGGGGGYCVITSTPILMADNETKKASEIIVGDFVRTQHHITKEWGDHDVTAISYASDEVFIATIAGNELIGTGNHQVWVNDRWVRLKDIGTAHGRDVVAKITVRDAQTYMSNGVLSHNAKQFNNVDIQ